MRDGSEMLHACWELAERRLELAEEWLERVLSEEEWTDYLEQAEQVE